MSRGSKNNLVSTLSRDKRLALIERQAADLSLAVQADLLSLSRASLYYRRKQPLAQEVTIKHRIDELYTDHPFYGSRRLRVCLQREGLIVNRKAVQRYMRDMGIVAMLSGAKVEPKSVCASGLPLFVAWRAGGPTRPHLGHRYSLNANA